jgi:DNA modification methylase
MPRKKATADRARPPAAANVDPRNQLNNLTNKDWMISTKSVWKSAAAGALPADGIDDAKQAFTQWLVETRGAPEAETLLGQLLPGDLESRPPARDPLKSQHPATFAETDIEKLISFFTRQGDRVLDPFVGSGSTLVACRNTKRSGVGIELVPRWAEVAQQRSALNDLPLFSNLPLDQDCPQEVIVGDARQALRRFKPGSFDFIVTSPPYWKILHKDTDHKVSRERKDKGLDTRYSELDEDLGNIASYRQFLRQLGKVFTHCARVLKPRKYLAVVVSDFRDRGKFVAYHADISQLIETCGFALQGITILVQDSKNLYPYGIPYAFVSNINHQYILIFRKAEHAARK